MFEIILTNAEAYRLFLVADRLIGDAVETFFAGAPSGIPRIELLAVWKLGLEQALAEVDEVGTEAAHE